MKCSVENLEATKVKLTVETPYEELKPALEAAYKEVAKQINVPGFRRGHVPARVIDQRVGRVYVIEQAINEKLPQLYRQAIEEADIRPLAQPEIDVTQIPNASGENGGELIFTALVEIVPEFDMPQLSELELQVDSASVSDDDVEEELDSLRMRFATLVTVQRPAAKGDFVSIDMTARLDGNEIDSASGISYEVGSGNLLEGMDEAITGLSADEDTTYQTTLAGGEHAGERADVSIKVVTVKERELPQADDDFAQLASEFDTIGQLRVDLREQAAKNKRAGQAVAARDALSKELEASVDFPLPTGVIDKELQAQLPDDASDEDKDKARSQLEESLRRQIILDRLVEERNIEVSQQELIEFVLHTSQSYGIDPSALMGEGGEQMGAMMADIARNKALVSVLSEVTVKDSQGEVLDLSEFTKDAHSQNDPIIAGDDELSQED